MPQNPLMQLDPGQFKATTSRAKNVLCLAGAGSGKTRVLTTRVFYLVKKLKISEENILTITFTRNAANEMKERLQKLGIKVEKLWCCTFHSACYRILQELNPNLKFNIIDEGKQDQLLLRLIKYLSRKKDFGYRLHSFCEENNWPFYLFYEEVKKILKECKNRTINLESIIPRCRQEKDEDVLDFYRLLYFIKYHYEQMLATENLLDFSDLILRAIAQLNDNPLILQKYQRRFKYLLVDEFQDVDFAQMKFLKLLNGSANNLFAVGDDWQSIYGFRGGDVKYILNFSREFRGECETIVLPYNYRSDENIVKAAAKFIKHNKKQKRKKIKAFNKSKMKIKIYRSFDEDDGVKFTLDTIKKLLRFNVVPQSIMLLGRNWKNLEAYQNALLINNIKGVQVNSIHGAKGMESEVVFLVGLHRGRFGFPCLKEDYDIVKLVKDVSQSDSLEEERRSMYVAITRAKKLLFIITEKDKESIFVKELSKRYCRLVK